MFESKISILCYGKCQVKLSETCFKQHFASNETIIPKIFKNPAQSALFTMYIGPDHVQVNYLCKYILLCIVLHKDSKET